MGTYAPVRAFSASLTDERARRRWYHPPGLPRQSPAFAVLGGMCAGLSRLPVILRK